MSQDNLGTIKEAPEFSITHPPGGPSRVCENAYDFLPEQGFCGPMLSSSPWAYPAITLSCQLRPSERGRGVEFRHSS